MAPMYNFFCPTCDAKRKNVFIPIEEIKKSGFPKCKKCKKQLDVDFTKATVGIGRTDSFQGVSWRICGHCKLRSVRDKERSLGGCSGGKKCRGFEAFDPSVHKKKKSTPNNLRGV